MRIVPHLGDGGDRRDEQTALPGGSEELGLRPRRGEARHRLVDPHEFGRRLRTALEERRIAYPILVAGRHVTEALCTHPLHEPPSRRTDSTAEGKGDRCVTIRCRKGE